MIDNFASIADALSSRYRFERPLQSGITAHVYVAEERAGRRRVAVKVLREEMTATVDAERFLAEIRVCAELRHPNIVPVYDSGDVGGLPYYVMPFIDGETLRARLARAGRLSFAETLRIAEDIARALDFAHRHNIVHRDIKPENVMLHRGRALVLDFGIALAMDSMEASRWTLPGLTLGTVHYMSPEQAGGEASIDGRSDVYSLGCLVYEMMSGRPPFTGSTSAVIRRHLASTPRPLTSACPGTPAQVGCVLSRALRKDPAARHATAGDFVLALRAAAPRVRVVGRRVAVLSFAHLGPEEPTIDTFSDALGEEVAAELRNLEGVVVAPGSWLHDRRVDVHMGDIARRMGADVLLFGNVHGTGGGTVRVSAALIEALSGCTLWSGEVFGQCRDVLDRQWAPAAAVARAVGAALGVGRRARREASS